MGGQSTPDSPSTGTCPDEPVDSTTTECAEDCWTEDYEHHIRVNSYGRYFRKYRADGTEYSYTFRKRYKILVPLLSGTPIVVEVRFKAEADSGVSQSDIDNAKSRLEQGVRDNWNTAFSIDVTDCGCGTRLFQVQHRIVWVDSGEDYTLSVHATYPREGLSGSVMNVSSSTTAWTYAHEYAHAIGLPDEYSYSTDTETVRYIKPDGSLDTAVSAPPNGKPATEPDATIMSSVDCTTKLLRHGWNIAIEVQELLRSETGRTIICTVV